MVRINVVIMLVSFVTRYLVLRSMLSNIPAIYYLSSIKVYAMHSAIASLNVMCHSFEFVERISEKLQ